MTVAKLLIKQYGEIKFVERKILKNIDLQKFVSEPVNIVLETMNAVCFNVEKQNTKNLDNGGGDGSSRKICSSMLEF